MSLFAQDYVGNLWASSLGLLPGPPPCTLSGHHHRGDPPLVLLVDREKQKRLFHEDVFNVHKCLVDLIQPPPEKQKMKILQLLSNFIKPPQTSTLGTSVEQHPGGWAYWCRVRGVQSWTEVLRCVGGIQRIHQPHSGVIFKQMLCTHLLLGGNSMCRDVHL